MSCSQGQVLACFAMHMMIFDCKKPPSTMDDDTCCERLKVKQDPDLGHILSVRQTPLVVAALR